MERMPSIGKENAAFSASEMPKASPENALFAVFRPAAKG